MALKRFLTEAKKLIQLGSVSESGDEELSNYLSHLMRDRGLHVNLQHVTHSLVDTSKRQFNVVGVLGDPLVDRKIRKGLLLYSHLDTSRPGRADRWSMTEGRPFDMSVHGNLMHGLGVAQGKVDFLCKLFALQKFREKKLRQPVYLVGACGHELGMFGCNYLIQSLTLNPNAVLVGMPTELSVVRAHKSLLTYKVTMGYQTTHRDARGFNRRVSLYSYGRTAHNAYPDQGENAVLQLLEFVKLSFENGFDIQLTEMQGGWAGNQIPDEAYAEFYLTSHQFEDFKRFFREVIVANGKEHAFRIELGGLGDKGISFLPEVLFPAVVDLISLAEALGRELESDRNDEFDPPFATVSFNRIEQGVGQTDIYLDFRMLPVQSEQSVQDRVNGAIQKIASRYPSLNLSAQLIANHAGLNVDRDDIWLRSAIETIGEAGLEPRVNSLSYCSEAGLFSKKGFPVVAFGPGEIKDNIHGPDERIDVDQLQKAILVYEKFIERECL